MTVLHVAAHPDDDLLFMSPDLAEEISAGQPVVTVYMTAGQITGDGATEGERARNRQRGVCDAYAQMAGVSSSWTGALVGVAGRLVERYTLDGAGVDLLFFGLRDGELDDLYGGVPHATVIPDGGLGAPQYTYTAGDAHAALAALCDMYQPTVVRSLDLLPEARYTPHDHADHTAAARFVAGATGLPTVPYRGYSISSLPVNLPPAVAAAKKSVFDTYRVFDAGAAPSGWTERMHRRWPCGVNWAGRNADGRLQVFVVRSGVLWTWWQTTTGGWSQPRALGGAGGPIAPAVTVGYDLDGRMEVAARRLSDHRIVLVYQTSPNGGWAPSWVDLGNHNAGMPNEDQMGCPTLSRHADGRLVLMVQNGGGGLSCKSQTAPGGSWGSWVDLHGTDVQDGVTAVSNPNSCVEVFAATRSQVMHWYQSTPNGPFVLDTALPSLVPCSPPTAVVDAAGCIRVVYREAGGTNVAVSVQGTPCSSWLPAVSAPGSGGVGQPAAVLDAGGVNVFARDGAGGVSVAALDASGVPGPWSPLGGVVDCPAAVVDQSGAVQVFAADAGVQPACLPAAGLMWTALP